MQRRREPHFFPSVPLCGSYCPITRYPRIPFSSSQLQCPPLHPPWGNKQRRSWVGMIHEKWSAGDVIRTDPFSLRSKASRENREFFKQSSYYALSLRSRALMMRVGSYILQFHFVKRVFFWCSFSFLKRKDAEGGIRTEPFYKSLQGKPWVLHPSTKYALSLRSRACDAEGGI